MDFFVNIFDLPGQEFLLFFILISGFGVLLAFLFRYFIPRLVSETEALPNALHPFDLAYLSGGFDAVINSALSVLRRHQLTSIHSTDKTFRVTSPIPTNAHPVLKELFHIIELQSGKTQSGITIDMIREKNITAIHNIRQRLEELHLMLSKWKAMIHRDIPLYILIILLLIGGIKISIGILRNRPVEFLIALCIVNVFIYT
ncbi:MAG: TIGR04222 domain-containing membrane protein [Ignavibacteriae bacterium]|nr:TIGR04222 domain-containing membrane protein [Ignavibacteriota bacterium]